MKLSMVLKKKEYSKKVKIKCTKKDGKWEAEKLEDNENFSDAVLGGFQTITQQLNESLANYSE